MEVTAIIAGASILIATIIRPVLIWGLVKRADRSGRRVKIGGINPLAVEVEYGRSEDDEDSGESEEAEGSDESEEIEDSPGSSEEDVSGPARRNGKSRRRRAIGS